MPVLVNYGGSDDLCPAGPLFSNLMDSSLLLSLAPKVDVFCPPRKRARVTAPFIFKGVEKDGEKQKPQLCSIDVLPDECLFEILRRLPGSRDRSKSACVSKRWLMLLSNIRDSEMIAYKKNGFSIGESLKKPLPDLNDAVSADEEEGEPERAGYLTRDLKAKEATDVRLAAMAVGTGGHGGLGKLYIQGSNATRPLTDTGLSAVAHGCPSLRVLSMWNTPFISDAGLSEIANGCPMLEKLDLCRCPLISDKGLIAVAQKCPKLTSLTIESCSNIGNEGLHAIGHCCPKLKSIIIRDSPGVGDRGVASLVSAASSLASIKLQSINISDASLAVIGHYGKAVSDLALTGLQYVSERGFWVMSNALGLQKLKSITINSCNGVTDLGLEAIAKGCPNLKQLFLRRCCYLSDAGLKLIAKTARALENLHLEECNRISLIGVLGCLLSCSAKFRALSLVKCFGIKDTSSYPTLLPSCMSLQSLTIRDCPGFTSTSLAVVGKICPQLQHVDLSGLVGATDAGLLPVIESSVGLVTVSLSGCVDLTDAVITALAKEHGTTLQMLNIDSCKNVTDKSLLAIADCCSLLDDLDMSRCTISDYGVAVLASARQLKLRVLSLAGCSKLSQKSLPFLGNMGRSLLGLNLQNCNLINTQGIGALEEKLWWCDVLY